METLSPSATYEQLASGGTCVWWQLTTFVRVQGEGTFDFLDSVATQHLDGIEPGHSRHALFLTNKARIIAATMAYRADAQTLLLELDERLADELVSHLKKYKLRAKCTIERVDLRTTSIVGPRAQEWIDRDSTEREGWYDSPAYGVPAAVYIGAVDAVHDLVNVRLPAAGIQHADAETVDAARIERGIASLGDMLPGSMPAEVGAVPLAVSLDKGCYLGQEPVARLHYRGKPNRTLRTVSLATEIPDDYGADDDFAGDDYLALVAPPADGADTPGKRVGTLTSWAHSPTRGLVGLAIVRREVEDGTTLRLAGTDDSDAVGVTPTPLEAVAPAEPAERH